MNAVEVQKICDSLFEVISKLPMLITALKDELAKEEPKQFESPIDPDAVKGKVDLENPDDDMEIDADVEVDDEDEDEDLYRKPKQSSPKTPRQEVKVKFLFKGEISVE
ncbi:MAG: hypothetical protein EXS59_02130 [Candidatus Taylorbacteria bacterium]|nr:hypothetical protein [Candidatus Taylorbacteria bacterium]